MTIRLPRLHLRFLGLWGMVSGLLGTVLGAAAVLPVQPGQVWTITATTAERERFTTTLRLNSAAPTGTPLAFQADRGVLLLDAAHGTLIALDLLDARAGGMGLACVVDGVLDAPELNGVLASGTLEQLPDQLKTVLAVVAVARTPTDRAAAVQELRLGTCTLTRSS
jgi:hypothetical protein